jgi:hypothetical protein
MFYIFSFVVKILLVLTYDLRSVAQTMNDSPFYVMWVIGLEVQITTSTTKLPVPFCGQFWTPLHNHGLQCVVKISVFRYHVVWQKLP